MGVIGGEDALEQGEALGRRGARVAVEGAARGADRALNVFRAAHGNDPGRGSPWRD